MKLNYIIHSTDPITNKKYISKIGNNFNIANTIAKKAVSDGRVDVNIEVVKADDDSEDQTYISAEESI